VSKRASFVAFITLFFAALFSAGSMAVSQPLPRTLESAPIPPTASGGVVEAERRMEMGRKYTDAGNYRAAVLHFRVVVTRFPSSAAVDEALYRLTDLHLKLGLRGEAQTAAAVLNRKFPRSHWRSDAIAVLKTAGLDPAEDETSWISLAFR
jgi:TolA-binding protein